MDKKKISDFTIKGPYLLTVEEDRPELKSGCSVLDVVFNDPVAVGEITFKNYYTASFTISIKRVPADKDVKNRDTLPWQDIIKHYVLMKNPHCETGSQDIISLRPDANSSWTGIVLMRFILNQPSNLWRRYTIEDLSFYKEMPAEPKQPFVPRMFAATTPELKDVIQDKSNVKNSAASVSSASSTSEITASLQNMKNVIELMKGVHTEGATVGRFEVDGSYDIDFLDTK